MPVESDDEDDATQNPTGHDGLGHSGPYFLQSMIKDVPLLADQTVKDVEITCVELWEGNVYIGTSQSEVLHFVLIPGQSDSAAADPEFILASRSQLQQQPAVSSSDKTQAGVQQILLLTRVSKACIRCNGTLTFYTLPELSPAFASFQVRNCDWVGGVDLDLAEDPYPVEAEHVMLSRKGRISLVKVGNDPRPLVVRNIDYPGSLIAVRRGSVACVATAHSYALLDVDHQQKIPLFPISSQQDQLEPNPEAVPEPVQPNDFSENQDPSQSVPQKLPVDVGRAGHGSAINAGDVVQKTSQASNGEATHEHQPNEGANPSQPLAQLSSQNKTAKLLDQTVAFSAAAPYNKPLPIPPTGQQVPPSAPSNSNHAFNDSLKPHILSPTSSEFLLTTGTTTVDRGVGIFVNLDGDVCRGTIEFARYPRSIVLDSQEGNMQDVASLTEENADDYVLAVLEDENRDGETGIEIQPLSLELGNTHGVKAWLTLPSRKAAPSTQPSTMSVGHPVGIQKVKSACTMMVERLRKILQLVRLRMPSEPSVRHNGTSSQLSPNQSKLQDASASALSQQASRGRDKGPPPELVSNSDARAASRLREEEAFARRFSVHSSRLVVWSGTQIWWVVRNPLALRLDASLEAASIRKHGNDTSVDRRKVIQILNSIAGQEPKTETHFLSLGYARQKASLLLFLSFLRSSSSGETIPEQEMSIIEQSLLEGAVDPRVVMALIPFLRQYVSESEQGIWIHGGIEALVASHLSLRNEVTKPKGPVTLLVLLWRYLAGWRRKKGFGSIADEKQVFRSVDGALLHVLLELDRSDLPHTLPRGSVRAELYSLVDHGVDCFDLAVELLERYRRLYILSRLYHSRKMSREVLSTWRRILEGNDSEGEEFVDGENIMRKYLAELREAGLVAEFGAWLAKRNPALGIMVFMDDKSRTKLEPGQVIAILKPEAPEALKQYLEHLIFGRNELRYTNELVTYYLDRVLAILEQSSDARSTLAQSYETYRALEPPRPTYREFISENAVSESWWYDRLRLLELLGGSHGAASAYDVPSALARLEPFEKELVPEMIILDGKQARHQSALRLLTHGLGDYDSAVNYCLLGGAGIFHPTFGAESANAPPSNEEQAALFTYLLSEFLHIEDPVHRAEQTSRLLARFGRWYDAQHVLSLVPDDWSVEMLSGFVVSALRQLQAEHCETMVVRALSGAENLKVHAQFIDRFDEAGPVVEAAD